ncbi:hypothetical protein AcW1_008226 [Taiwanofungus camphoratus]|nr:hypothetical protein AcW1_008226 [Antrodia cinnamomea]KAI0955986.1 hypothetical protein AcV7_006512 [Antrodia cinnamomea]
MTFAAVDRLIPSAPFLRSTPLEGPLLSAFTQSGRALFNLHRHPFTVPPAYSPRGRPVSEMRSTWRTCLHACTRVDKITQHIFVDAYGVCSTEFLDVCNFEKASKRSKTIQALTSHEEQRCTPRRDD